MKLSTRLTDATAKAKLHLLSMLYSVLEDSMQYWIVMDLPVYCVRAPS